MISLLSVVDAPTTTGSLIGAGHVVDSLAGAIRDGDQGLRLVPGLLKRVCAESCWRERYVEPIREIVTFATFTAFVEAHPPAGLGIDLDTLRKLCRDDTEARDLIDRETQRPPSIHANAIDNIQSTAPTGTSADAALRRLRKDRKDLHARVIAGDISPHAAMVEAGFRPKTATVRTDNPAHVAAFLAKHFDPDTICAIAADAIRRSEGGR